jgi:N-acetyl sugar amidotransferase
MKICKRCVMDTSDPDITFDSKEYCNHCTNALNLLNSYPFNLSVKKKEKELKGLYKKIKQQGKGKEYDCVMGISGGVDSTYAIYLAKKAGLRPLAVHLDNGWNSELSVKNIENCLKKLGIELYTYVLDWEEFKDIQLSFLKAGVPDLEIPTDHAIIALLFDVARKNNIKYVLTGENTATESIMPRKWSQGHSDWKYIRAVHKKFGTKPLITYPMNSFFKIFINHFVYNIKWKRILNYIDYDKENALKILEKELGYKRYIYKHGESVYTHFKQSYILPERFGFDKRKAHFSSLIIAKQMTRKKAIEELKKPLFDENAKNDELKFVCDKFGLSIEEFDKLMKLPLKFYHDYPNMNNKFINMLKGKFVKMKLK